MSTSQSVIFDKRPGDKIVLGQTFRIVRHEMPLASQLKEGEVLFECIYLSIDPAMRTWLNGSHYPLISPMDFV